MKYASRKKADEFFNIFREIVDSILKNKAKHVIKNKHLKIFQSKEKPEDPKRARVEIKAEKVSHQSVVEHLKEVTDPEEQLVYLVEILELTGDDILNRTQIAHHIQVRNIFQMKKIKCRANENSLA